MSTYMWKIQQGTEDVEGSPMLQFFSLCSKRRKCNLTVVNNCHFKWDTFLSLKNSGVWFHGDCWSGELEIVVQFSGKSNKNQLFCCGGQEKSSNFLNFKKFLVFFNQIYSFLWSTVWNTNLPKCTGYQWENVFLHASFQIFSGLSWL